MKMKTRWSRWILRLIFCFWGLFSLFYLIIIYPRLNQYWYAIPRVVSIEAMKEKWGSIPFDATKFRNGTPEIRATMAADLIQSRRFIGKPVAFAYKELGKGDILRINGYIPDYTLERPQESWKKNALYFLRLDYDRTTTLINKTVVIQKCCESPYATFLNAKGLLRVE